MSARFLAQLAHRAVAGSDVRPRIASRFETLAPMEHSVERGSDVPPAPVAQPPTVPSQAPEITERAPRVKEAPMPELRLETRNTVTHRETVEHVFRRAEPLLIEPPARATIANEIHVPERAAPPVPLLAPAPAPESPGNLPLLAQPHSIVDATPRARPAFDDSALAPRTYTPAVTPAVAPMLVAPAALAMPAAVVRERAVAAPAPAPIEIVIGRIEIRADTATRTSSEPRDPAPTPRRTATSLDDYLHGREGHTR